MPDPIASYSPRPALLPEADAGRSACFGPEDASAATCAPPPDEDLACISARAATLPMPAPETSVADHPFFDYVTLTVGIGAVFGGSLSATVDREGHVYLAAAIGAGLGPTIGTVSLTAGHIVDDPHAASGAPSIIEGDSVNGTVAYGLSLGATSYPGGTALEIGIGTPQIGVSFEHAWEINGGER